MPNIGEERRYKAQQIGDGGTTGSLSGNVADNGTLAFNRISGGTDAYAQQVVLEAAGELAGDEDEEDEA